MVMAMDGVLKQLESRIEELVAAYVEANDRAAELGARAEELEAKLNVESENDDRVAVLEKQRDDLGKRLEKVLAVIDKTLASD